MYIKVERKDKTQLHHAKSYYSNECKEEFHFNVERADGEMKRYSFKQGEKFQIFIMNDNGKTVDRI